jgi:hypothetical protein
MQPELNRMLRALRGFRQSSLKRGVWQTECNLEDLARVVGLDALSTADLFSTLVDEGYVRGHLLYKRQDPEGEAATTHPDENTPVPYGELGRHEKRSAYPVRLSISALTQRGLVAIDELPDPDSTSGEEQVEEVVTPSGPERGRLTRIFIPVLNFGGNVKEAAADLREHPEEKAEEAAFTFAPVAGALAGFVAALIPLAYPAGLIALWIQLSNQFDYGLWRALYAASLARSAVVVGKVPFIVALSFLSALVPMWAWYAYARIKVKDDLDANKQRERRKSRIILFFARKSWIILFFKLYAVLILLGLVISLLIAAMPKDDIPGILSFLTGRWTFLLLFFFLSFTVAEVVFGGVIFFLKGLQEGKEKGWEAARGSLYLGLATVYAGSVAAGVCLAGLQSPSLPTTELTLDGPNGTENVVRVGILSNSNGYWYVVNYCENDDFLAVPNTKVEEVDTIVDEPNILEKRHSKIECDTTDPETTIDSGPSGRIASDNASFDFSSNEERSTYECRRNGGAYARCTSPQDYRGLSDGEHTFSVRAMDAAGNTDNTPAQRTWTVDTMGPETTIDSGPSGTVTSAEANFAFSSSEGRSTFECSLEGGTYSPCTSPKGYPGLPDGEHTFSVKATDAAGNEDAAPASRTWTVEQRCTAMSASSAEQRGPQLS